jgi:hypothetical protein
MVDLSRRDSLKAQTFSILLIGFVLSGLSVAETPLTPTPDAISQKSVGPHQPDKQPAKIIFPIIPVLDEEQAEEEDLLPPAPKPPKNPKFVSELNEDTLLVIESDSPITVTSSPLGHVAIQPEEGPVKPFAKFADGTGKMEKRLYKAKYVFFITAVKQGKIEILIFEPNVVVLEKDIPRYTLNVMGVMPIPPPVPPKPEPNPKPDPPKPDPDPMPEPVSESILIEVLEDPLARNLDTSMVLEAIVGWSEFKNAGHDWIRYSVRSPEPLALEAIALAKEQNVPPPVLIVRDKTTRKPIRTLNLPKTFADLKRVLGELTGGIP